MSKNLFFGTRTFSFLAGPTGLVKPIYESQRIGKGCERDFSKRRGYRLGGRVSEATAQIQPGSYFGRLDMLGDIDHGDGDHMVELFPMMAYLRRRRHVLRRHPRQNFAA